MQIPFLPPTEGIQDSEMSQSLSNRLQIQMSRSTTDLLKIMSVLHSKNVLPLCNIVRFERKKKTFKKNPAYW